MTQKEWKKLALEALDNIAEIFLDKLDDVWEDEELWNRTAEIRTHILIARRMATEL